MSKHPYPTRCCPRPASIAVQRWPTVGAGTSLVGSMPGRGPATAAGACTLPRTHRRHAGATDQTSSTTVTAKRAGPMHLFAVQSTFQIMAPSGESVRETPVLPPGPCHVLARKNSKSASRRLSENLNLFLSNFNGPTATSGDLSPRRYRCRETDSKCSVNKKRVFETMHNAQYLKQH